MSLVQYPVPPIGSPDDPLADPYDDPTYSFNFRTPDQSRSEDKDSTGRVRGLYSYIDDVGERHSVRYAAGAGTGFEVSNAVPDSPSNVGYTSPLYKAPPRTRGRMTVQRGPGGSYKLIAAGPDHRRAESRATDGVVRGTFSYLDDVGVQRTVEYIAGAGIGYRVLKNRVGPGTHINPSISDFRLSDTDFKLANDFGTGVGGGLSATETSSRRGGGASISSNRGGTATTTVTRIGGGSSSSGYDVNARGGTRTDSESNTVSKSRPGSNFDASSSSSGDNFRPGSNRNRGEERTGTDFGEKVRTSDGGSSVRGSNVSRFGGSSGRGGTSTTSNTNLSTSSSSSSSDRSNTNNYKFEEDDFGSLSPLITANRKILEIDRERDWVEKHRDSTIIKNVGKWYIGLPAGQSVRAHVQNIDLTPLGGRRGLSPSEALRQDEIADMVASYESEAS
ncbi:uncharacterized protein LOC119668649 [Teleopsis dalmanni]|uniref:uncharacterized protein LOC119668649 n=1 Tax=Teleopsis dalmanni TaxID=139649 RepID=UPI0018CCC085|nr:uncharacterized protein LOC119668649 [Teleopsis dalmanni]